MNTRPSWHINYNIQSKTKQKWDTSENVVFSGLAQNSFFIELADQVSQKRKEIFSKIFQLGNVTFTNQNQSSILYSINDLCKSLTQVVNPTADDKELYKLINDDFFDVVPPFGVIPSILEKCGITISIDPKDIKMEFGIDPMLGIVMKINYINQLNDNYHVQGIFVYSLEENKSSEISSEFTCQLISINTDHYSIFRSLQGDMFKEKAIVAAPQTDDRFFQIVETSEKPSETKLKEVNLVGTKDEIIKFMLCLDPTLDKFFKQLHKDERLAMPFEVNGFKIVPIQIDHSSALVQDKDSRIVNPSYVDYLERNPSINLVSQAEQNSLIDETRRKINYRIKPKKNLEFNGQYTKETIESFLHEKLGGDQKEDISSDIKKRTKLLSGFLKFHKPIQAIQFTDEESKTSQEESRISEEESNISNIEKQINIIGTTQDIKNFFNVLDPTLIDDLAIQDRLPHTLNVNGIKYIPIELDNPSLLTITKSDNNKETKSVNSNYTEYLENNPSINLPLLTNAKMAIDAQYEVNDFLTKDNNFIIRQDQYNEKDIKTFLAQIDRDYFQKRAVSTEQASQKSTKELKKPVKK